MQCAADDFVSKTAAVKPVADGRPSSIVREGRRHDWLQAVSRESTQRGAPYVCARKGRGHASRHDLAAGDVGQRRGLGGVCSCSRAGIAKPRHLPRRAQSSENFLASHQRLHA